MAQALKDANVSGFVHTVDIDESNIASAKKNVEKAGLIEIVKFYNENSITFLEKLISGWSHIDFCFLDDLHEYWHVKKEFSMVYPKIVACNGKVMFDNASYGDVYFAVRYIKKAYPGNVIEFKNCSWGPPGMMIWQPPMFSNPHTLCKVWLTTARQNFIMSDSENDR
jgi:predicted O-methyltransferase YrrM